MIGHLGTRVSALLDGQLSHAEEERAWEHVHTCHQCRDAVEREGWVKTRLAGMQLAGAGAPSTLKGSLLCRGIVDWPDLPDHPAYDDAAARRRHLGLTGIGSGALGAAVMGVLALGASPANAPGAVLQPVGESFGASLTHAFSTVLVGDSLSSSRGPGEPGSAKEPRGLRRTLAP